MNHPVLDVRCLAFAYPDAWILDESPGEYRWGSIDTPEPGPGEVVLLAGQPLAGDVDRRLDVAVVEHHGGAELLRPGVVGVAEPRRHGPGQPGVHVGADAFPVGRAVTSCAPG